MRVKDVQKALLFRYSLVDSIRLLVSIYRLGLGQPSVRNCVLIDFLDHFLLILLARQGLRLEYFTQFDAFVLEMIS